MAGFSGCGAGLRRVKSTRCSAGCRTTTPTQRTHTVRACCHACSRPTFGALPVMHGGAVLALCQRSLRPAAVDRISHARRAQATRRRTGARGTTMSDLCPARGACAAPGSQSARSRDIVAPVVQEAMLLIVCDMGANINAINEGGNTPLHLAAYKVCELCCTDPRAPCFHPRVVRLGVLCFSCFALICPASPRRTQQHASSFWWTGAPIRICATSRE
jgi:hypothetical protein